MTTSTLEQRARRAAKRVGLAVTKSRERTTHTNNCGEFMLFDPLHNHCVNGMNYDMTAEDVIAWCADALPAVPYGAGSSVMCFAGYRGREAALDVHATRREEA